jgi:hypothetical protein
MGSISIMGWIALLLGVAIRYIIGRRKFNRRAITGLEQFNSYEKAVGTTLLEKLFKLFALILILAGILLLILGWYESRH